jgi:hypothetical protein
MLDAQRRNNPDAYRLVTRGIGLDEIAVAPIEHFDLFRPADESAAAPGATAVREPARTNSRRLVPALA